MQKCPYCGSEDLISDPSRGDVVCGNPACGELLEEQAMVAETSFMQTSGGAMAASGTRVMWGGMGNFGCAGISQSSQELAVARGITKIGWIADRLQLSSPIQESGRRMFQLAVQMNFNVGHPTRLVACACLYIVCRRSKSPHLLIDFSDVLKEPVKKLGKIYTGLLKRLVGGDPSHQASLCDMVQVPMIDPSIYIERYARKLDLRGAQNKVQNTAMRFIQLMNRDWISVGRRPNSICGAALYLASFHHGFKVPAKDIANMVRLQEGTLKNRLMELRETPLALMSREQFEKADFTQEALEDGGRKALPPCMLKRRRAEAQAALLDKEREAIVDASRPPALEDGSVSSASAQPAAPLVGFGPRRIIPGLPSKRKRLPPVPEFLSLADGEARGSGSASSHSRTAAGSHDRGPKDSAAGTADKYTKLDPSEENIEDIAQDILQAIVPSKMNSGPLDIATMSGASQSIEALLTGKPGFSTGGVDGAASDSNPGTPKSVTDVASLADHPEETLSDVDDEDLEAYLLDAEEQEHKSDIWHEVNKDYLEEWHIIDKEKQRKRRAQGDMGDATASESGRSRATSTSGTSSKRSKRNYPAASSCTQSAMIALSKKGKAGPNRINIDALESLFS